MSSRSRFNALQLCLATLAVVGQLLFAPLASARSPDLPGAICHVDDDGVPAPTAPAHHHDMDCGLCPACLSLAQTPLLLSEPPAAPLPRRASACPFIHRSSPAPQSARIRTSAQPRAPPTSRV